MVVTVTEYNRERENRMTTITTGGRLLAGELNRYIGTTYETQATCSLIVRHAKTLRRYEEMLCGDGIHSGEWVNEHHDRLDATCERLAKRIDRLVSKLPEVDGGRIVAHFRGDPRGCVVKLEIPTADGAVREVAVW